LAHKPDIAILQFDAQAMSCLRVAGGVKGIHVLEHAREQGPWNAEGELETALREFVKRLSLANASVYTILPRHEITARVLTLPSQNEAELANMLRFSAEEFVPYASDELIISFSKLKSLPGGESQVFAVLAHRDLVEGHLAFLRKCGVEPAEVLLSSACLASAAIAGHGGEDDRFALVDLGSSGLEVLAFEGRRLQYSRGVAMVQAWNTPLDEAPGMLDELALELRGSLAAYRRESSDGMGVEEVYLASESTDTTPFAESLTHETGKTCAPAAFARGLVSQGAEKLVWLPVAALGAVLAAQGRAAVDIRLLPAEVIQERAMAGVQRTAMRIAAMAVLVLLALGGLYAQASHARLKLVRELEQEIARISPQAEGVAEKQRQLHILRQQVEQRGTVLELLSAIASAAPADSVNITRFVYQRDDGIDLWGRARSIADVHSFAHNIRGMAQGHLSMLSQAASMYENEGREREVTVYDYQISVPFPESNDEQDTD